MLILAIILVSEFVQRLLLLLVVIVEWECFLVKVIVLVSERLLLILITRLTPFGLCISLLFFIQVNFLSVVAMSRGDFDRVNLFVECFHLFVEVCDDAIILCICSEDSNAFGGIVLGFRCGNELMVLLPLHFHCRYFFL